MTSLIGKDDRKPRASEIWSSNGSARYETGDYEEALLSYDKALKNNPYSEKVLFRKAVTLSKIGKRHEAKEVLKAALESERYETGGCVVVDYDTPEASQRAIENFDRKLKEYPNDVGYLYLKGLAHANQGQYQVAIVCFDRIIGIEGEHQKAWRLKGGSFYFLDRIQEAEECFDKYVELENKEIWFETGFSFANVGQHEKAIEFFDKIIRSEPDNIAALKNKGACLEKLDRTPEARKCYDRAEKIESRYPQYWYHKGISLAVDKLHEKAIPYLDKAIAMDPDYMDAWYNKARCLAELGQHGEAIRCYNEAIAKSPKSFIIWYEKGLSHIALHQYWKAIKCFDEVLVIEPKHELALKHRTLARRAIDSRFSGCTLRSRSHIR